MSDRPRRGGCVLVTGACGFLGSAVVTRALAAGLEVRRTDRLARPRDDRAPYVQADIRVPEALGAVLAGVDAVIHAAGLAHVFDKSKGPAEFTAVNETGTGNVARAAVAAGVKHLVLVSSVSVYGGGTTAPAADAPCRPAGPYALSKHGAELRAAEAARHSQTGLTILRMATIYGPGDPGNVARLVRSIDRGRFIWIGRGANRKSLLYRDDAADACVQAVLKRAAGVRTYNVSAAARTMAEIVATIARHLDRPVRRWHVPGWAAVGGSALARAVCLGRGPMASLHGAVRKWLAEDVYPAERIAAELAFSPAVDLDEGLAREVAWYKQVRSAGGDPPGPQTDPDAG